MAEGRMRDSMRVGGGSVEFRDLTYPDGHIKTRPVLVHPGTAVAMAITPRSTAVFVRQFRPVIGQWSTELPGGVIESGESPITCVCRELREEAGFGVASVVPLRAVTATVGCSTEMFHLFVAHGEITDQAAETGADVVDILEWPIADLNSLLPTILDAKTVIGIHDYISTSRAEW